MGFRHKKRVFLEERIDFKAHYLCFALKQADRTLFVVLI